MQQIYQWTSQTSFLPKENFNPREASSWQSEDPEWLAHAGSLQLLCFTHCLFHQLHWSKFSTTIPSDGFSHLSKWCKFSLGKKITHPFSPLTAINRGFRSMWQERHSYLPSFSPSWETHLWPIFWLPLRLARDALQFWKTWGSLVSWIVMSIKYLSSCLKNHQSSLPSSFGNMPPTDMSYLCLKDVWLVSAKFSECFQKSCKLALNMRSIIRNMEILEELSSEDNHITHYLNWGNLSERWCC